MPRLNTRGQVVQSLGLVWLDDDTLIGQRQQPDGSWAVCTAPSEDGPWTIVANRGCNFIAAGGGLWAAYGGDLFGPGAIPGDAGIPAGLDGRGAGSPDGTIALVEHYQSGQGLVLKHADSRISLPNAYPTSNMAVWDFGSALWMDAKAGLQVFGAIPMPKVLPGPVLWPSVFRALGGWWIAYHSTDAIGYVLHPFDSFEGYRLTLPPAFYPQAIALDDHTARLAWSVDPAESPAGLRVVNQDLRAPRVNLLPAEPIPGPEPPDPGPTPIPPDPDPQPPKPIPPKPIPPIPPRPYPVVRGAHMQTERGWLIGPGDRALAVDANGKASFERTDLTDADLLEATPQPDGRCIVRPVPHANFCVGADATGFNPSGNPALEYYATGGPPGNYELWFFGQWPSGIVQAVVEYINQGANHGRHFQAAGLTWVKQ